MCQNSALVYDENLTLFSFIFVKLLVLIYLRLCISLLSCHCTLSLHMLFYVSHMNSFKTCRGDKVSNVLRCTQC